MKKIIMMAMIAALAGLKPGFASGFEDLLAGAGAGRMESFVPAKVAAPAAYTAPVIEGPFDVRKLYVTSLTESWKDSFLIKFRKGADMNAVLEVLKRVNISPAQTVDYGGGFFVKIIMDEEFLPVKVMQLTDHTSVESVQIGRRAWNAMAGI